MTDRVFLAVWGSHERYSLSYEPMLKFQWWPSLYRFQGNGRHLYLWKFRFTRAARSE